MSTAERFSGFVDHIQRHLGRIRDSEPPTVDGGNRGFALFFLPNAGGDLISVVTNGLRFQQVRAILPQELVVTVHARHEQAARYLAIITADQVLRTGTGLVFDQVVLAGQPLIPDSRIQGVIASTHPYVDTDLETMPGADGKPELQLLTLVPISGPEGELARQQGTNALFGWWQERHSDLLDVSRASAV